LKVNITPIEHAQKASINICLAFFFKPLKIPVTIVLQVIKKRTSNFTVKNNLNRLKIVYCICPIFAKTLLKMESTKKSTLLYWALFFVSVAAFFFVYKIGGGYCSMVLPFNVTFFAKALDLV